MRSGEELPWCLAKLIDLLRKCCHSDTKAIQGQCTCMDNKLFRGLYPSMLSLSRLHCYTKPQFEQDLVLQEIMESTMHN